MTQTEQQTDSTVTTASAARPSSGFRLVWFVVKVCLPLIVVAVGATGAYYVYTNRPRAKQAEPADNAKLVRVASLEPSTERAIVRAMGTVISAREIALQPQVSGAIEKLNPALIPGGRVKKGAELLTIESAEYRAVLDRAEAELAGSEAQLQSATWELERLEGLQKHNAVGGKELDLARTAVRVSRANMAVGRSAVDLAKLNLARTRIRAPFNAIIAEKNVDLGARVSPGSKLATLVGTDEYWAKVSIPVDRLRWFDIPSEIGETGSRVRICQSGESETMAEWRGRVVRLLGDVEPQGRMARVLITVKDPLGLGMPGKDICPLLIGSYVRAEIEGHELSNVFVIPRSALREGDRVWLMGKDAKLVIKDVEVAWRDRKTVLVRSDFGRDDRLVVSDIATPVAGIALRIESSETKAVAKSPLEPKDETSGL